jgi:hypothetical protein
MHELSRIDPGRPELSARCLKAGTCPSHIPVPSTLCHTGLLSGSTCLIGFDGKHTHKE